MRAPTVHVHDLRLALPGRDGPLPVLDGVTFTVPAGRVAAVVGRSGCGKSTLLSILAGLQDADSGRVVLDGDPGARRLGRLTLMPQRDALMPWRTVAGNVAVAAELAGVPRRRADALARDALGRYGLAGFEDHYPHALSGGMRQRAALARTLLAGSGAWLLDEPFGALDALTRADLVTHLEAVWAEHRPTVVLVTHDLDEALMLADTVVVLTPLPARVADVVPVELDRPRGLASTAGPAFAAAKRRIVDALASAGALPEGALTGATA
ncbi:MAG: ABC transporter ATP-binding protein [Actinomycetota bacterium]